MKPVAFIYIKNNKIIKITPGFNYEENNITWISDKTRFSFDGMFSPERVLEGFVIYGNKTCKTSIMWEKLLNEIEPAIGTFLKNMCDHC